MSNMVIKTNIFSLNAHRNMKNVSISRGNAAMRLASGYRVNSAADDAAGLAISENMRAQIRGLNQASRNAQDAIALVQTAEGGLSEINSMIHRIRELVVQAANDTNTLQDRVKIQMEIDNLTQEIDSLANRLEYNTMKLLSGKIAAAPPTGPGITPAPWYHVYGARTGAGSLLNSTIQTQVQSSTFAPGNYFMLTIDNSTSTTYGFLFDISFAVMDADPTFDIFVQNDLFEADGSITDANRQRFINTLQEAMRLELEYHESFDGEPIGTYGSQNIIVDLTFDMNIVIGFDNNAFAILDIVQWVDPWFPTTPDPDDFGTGFFLSFFGNTPYGPNTSGLTPRIDYQRPLADGEEPPVTSGTPSANDTDRKFWFQLGANSGQGMYLTIDSANSLGLGIGNGAGVSNIIVELISGEEVSQHLTKLDNALSYVLSQRAILGAVQNRIEFTLRSLEISSENLSDSESRIRNADMAKEMMNFTKISVLTQSAMAMLSHLNQSPEILLQLLR